MAVVYTYVGILTVDVVFFRSPGVFHSQDLFPSMFRPRLWETSSGVVAVGVFAAEARRKQDSNPNSSPELFNQDHIAGRESLSVVILYISVK